MPPNESFNRWVSFDWRYGVCDRPLADRAITTCSRYERERLMYIDSAFMSPSVDVFFSRSEPARSTRLSLHRTTFSLDSTRDRIWTYTVKTAWPRVELRLSWWLATARFVSPSKSMLSASSSFVTFSTRSPFTCVAPETSSIRWSAPP